MLPEDIGELSCGKIPRQGSCNSDGGLELNVKRRRVDGRLIRLDAGCVLHVSGSGIDIC